MIEDVGLKQRIFADLERVCRPDAILSSNTSTIDISLIGAKTRAAERIVGAHFFSPAHIMPLLEIVRTDKTSPQARLRPLSGLVQPVCIPSSCSAYLPLGGFSNVQCPQIRGSSHKFRQSLLRGAWKALQLQGSFRVLNSSGCKGSSCASHFHYSRSYTVWGMRAFKATGACSQPAHSAQSAAVKDTTLGIGTMSQFLELKLSKLVMINAA